MSGLVVAVLTVVTLLFFTGLFEQLREARSELSSSSPLSS
jgi:hypothetical protein